ncbi:MAG: malate dehydrogenase [Candidatus Thermoplasmatota archaeon]|jgi:malate dehydrogenase|nr:malate dehydrogenase [Candidatus Thermoplasmatota archaeon]MCL5984816.1 malate dehydrogenase [Candidatus Thermoplasmatota archaeon]
MSRWAKISVVGAGAIGGSLAQRLAEADIADELDIIDIVEGLPQGKALDIEESAPVLGFSTHVRGSTQLEDLAGSNLVVLTAGFARKPGMSRSDLLGKNAGIIRAHAEAIKRFAPKAIVLVVTNPVDVMAYLVKQVTGFPRERILAESGTLDSSRFRLFVAKELGVAPRDVVGFVMGTHGDTMVPIISHCSVNGVPLTHLLPQEKIQAIVQRTKKGGGEIVDLLKSGSAYYAPSAAQLEMILSLARNERRLITASVSLEGEYGHSGIFLSVPVILSNDGLAKIVETALSSDEQKLLADSARAVKEDINLLATLPQ